MINEREYRPNKVWVYTEESYSEMVAPVVDGLKVISEAFGFKPDAESMVFEDSDFLGAGKKISGVVGDLKSEGWEVAIDITPGRKALVAGTLLSTAKIDVDHVFYLRIDSLDGAARPYPMIPTHFQHLQDFADLRRSGS